MKNSIFINIIVALIALPSCSSVDKKISSFTKGYCQYKLNNNLFDIQVSENYNQPNVKIALNYEAKFNKQITQEIKSLLNLVKSHNISNIDFYDIKQKVTTRMKNEITFHKKLAEYLKNSDIEIYKDEAVIEFIENYAVNDIHSGVIFLNKYYKNLLNGELPPSITLNQEKVYFCDENQKIILGKKQLNGIFHLLLNIALELESSELYNLKLNGEKYKNTSIILSEIPLPRKFITSDIYPQMKNSKYLSKTSNSSQVTFTIGTIGYDGMYSIMKTKYQNNPKFKNLPWYINAFQLNQEITPEFLLWSHRMFFKYDYIPAFFVNKLAIYESLIEKFNPIKIKNLKKDIKPGQLILVKNFSKTSVIKENIINGIDSLVGTVMDYDDATNTVIILTEHYNSNNKKLGLGYDIISLQSSIANKGIFLFNPINSILSENLSEKNDYNFNEEDELSMESENKSVDDLLGSNKTPLIKENSGNFNNTTKESKLLLNKSPSI